MISPYTTPVSLPLDVRTDLERHDRCRSAQCSPGLIHRQLPDVEPACVIARYADAGLMLGGPPRTADPPIRRVTDAS